MCRSDNIHLALAVFVATNVIQGGLAEVLHENTLFDFKNTCCAVFFFVFFFQDCTLLWDDLVAYECKCIRERLEELCLTWQYSWRCFCLNSLKGFVLTGWHLVHSVPKCCCVSCFSFYSWLSCSAVGSHGFAITARLCLLRPDFKMALYLMPFSQVICFSDLSFQGHTVLHFALHSFCV